ncbi:MAG TPA: phosphate signaling complex protein PhoU [Bacteroidales bacterium]|nr:phosphate signaling complex protein PhoU [Bacteroidales bacterium]
MERHFEQELEKLNKRLLKMSALVSAQIRSAMIALTNCDTELAEEVIENDTKLDELDVKIDKLCQRIFALTQPVATDLRLLMSALKMNNDLERMGDLAVNIAEKIEGLTGFKTILAELKIDELAGLTEIIIRDVMTILDNRNTVFVKDIFRDANVIKEKSQQVTQQIIAQMMEKSDVIIVATNLIIILSHIERIADYATNIAESIVFLVEGRMVKHSKEFEGETPAIN